MARSKSEGAAALVLIVGLVACGPAPQAPPSDESSSETSSSETLSSEKSATAAVRRALPCVYAAVDAYGELAEHDECAMRGAASGRWTIRPEHLAAIDFTTSPAPLWVDRQWYYVLPSGLNAQVLTFDNGPDPFVEGLARTRVRDTGGGGQIAFLDKSLTVVLDRDFDFAWPFENGRAKVCRGCMSRHGGEHGTIFGGVWGFVDRRGVEIVPVIHADHVTASRELDEIGAPASADRP